MLTALLLVGGAFAGVIAGKLWDRADRYVSTVKPAGRLWGWLTPNEPVQIVMSTGLIHHDEYIYLVFPTEAQAVAEMKSYLGSTLRLPVMQRLAHDLGDQLKNDLVLIGGPVANDVSRRVLEMHDVPFRFDGHTIVHEPSGDRWHAAVETRNGQTSISTDYCLIVRTQNPFNSNRGVVLIGGSRAYGTLAGARAMMGDGMHETLKHIKDYGEHYILLVETHVHNNVPGTPKIVKAWPLASASSSVLGASVD